MKWVALGLFISGVALLVTSINSNPTASFDNGTFVILVLGIIGGAILIVASAALFLVDLFVVVH